MVRVLQIFNQNSTIQPPAPLRLPRFTYIFFRARAVQAAPENGARFEDFSTTLEELGAIKIWVKIDCF